MDHSSGEEDDGSTILIDSGDDLYDSDVTEISGDDDDVQEVQAGQVPNSGSRLQAHEQAGMQSARLTPNEVGEESQSDSESVLLVPQPAASNQIAGGSNQFRPASAATALAPPGPIDLSHLNEPRLVHSPNHGSSSQGRIARTVHDANEPGTSSQSRERTGNEMQGSNDTGAAGLAADNGTVQMANDVPAVAPGSNNTEVQGTNDGQAANDMQELPANQPPAADDINDNEEEEPMDTASVVVEDESSNDSMSDFREPKKPACLPADDSGSSDDESQTCIICYEAWTTSGSHRLVSLRCGHLFGQSCIEQWLKGQGGRCPQCNRKAKKTDVRVIYAKALKVLDTSERDHALKELEKEKELRKKAEMDAAQTQLRYVMAMEEVKRMKAVMDAHQKSAAARNVHGSAGSSGSQLTSDLSSGRYVLDRTIQVSASGNCRVLAFDPTNQLVLASMPSPNNLFQGYGLKKISAMDFKTAQYLPVHSKPIRGLALSGRPDGLVLSASVDRVVKITSLTSNTVVQSYTCPMPAWCCAWNSVNTNYVYAGLQNGSLVVYDTRKPTGEVTTLAAEGSRCPIVSLKHVPNSANVLFACAGLLVGTLEGASFWEQLGAEEYRLHKLQLEGSCTGVTFEPNTRHCLASFRPTKTHPATRYVMCEMRRQLVGAHGNSLVSSSAVQTFYGGTTMKLLTQSAIFPSPAGEGQLIVCAGDEASSSVYTWEASTGRVRQKIPMGGTALDVCPFSLGETSYLAALTDKQVKLCRWAQER